MIEYHFHWLATESHQADTPAVRVEAESDRHGAALALRHFMQLGCDINAPLAHVDLTEPDGGKRTLLVEEVLEWLNDPEQAAFVGREDLARLLDESGDRETAHINQT